MLVDSVLIGTWFDWIAPELRLNTHQYAIAESKRTAMMPTTSPTTSPVELEADELVGSISTRVDLMAVVGKEDVLARTLVV